MIDTLCSEYGWTLDQARATGMAEALALRTTIALRHGYTWAEPSYVERELF